MFHLFTVIRLSFADLWHEKVLTLCLILSIGAILGPLLLLFGLKHGVIESMRNELLASPSTREMSPKLSQEAPFTAEWFSTIRERDEIEFVVPKPGYTGTTLRLAANDISKSRKVDVIASAPGDPSISFYNREPPSTGEIVMSYPLANALKVQKGDKVFAIIDRGGSFEGDNQVTAELLVKDVLPEKVDSIKETAWLPHTFLSEVQRYRMGIPVPSLGWTGQVTEVGPEFDSFVTITDLPLPEFTLAPSLVSKSITSIEFTRLTGNLLSDEDADSKHLLQWSATDRKIEYQDIQDLKSRMIEEGMQPVILPLIDLLPARVQSLDGKKEVPLGILVRSEASWLPSENQAQVNAVNGLEKIERESFEASENSLIHGPPAPAASIPKQIDTSSNRLTIRVGDWKQLPSGDFTMLLEGRAGLQKIPFKIKTQEGIPEGIGWVEPEVGGLLKHVLNERIVYSPDLQIFRYPNYVDFFYSFRLYASHLEDVPQLVTEFEGQGIEMKHEGGKILGILEMDRNLTHLFWLIASAAGVAGFFGLVASLFASVERKRPELGILQLLGLPKIYLFAFPVIQSLVLAVVSFILAFGLFTVFSTLINERFASKEGESFCSLREDHALIVLGLSVAFGVGASFFAATSSFRVQPSEALRSE